MAQVNQHFLEPNIADLGKVFHVRKPKGILTSIYIQGANLE